MLNFENHRMYSILSDQPIVRKIDSTPIVFLKGHWMALNLFMTAIIAASMGDSGKVSNQIQNAVEAGKASFPEDADILRMIRAAIHAMDPTDVNKAMHLFIESLEAQILEAA